MKNVTSIVLAIAIFVITFMQGISYFMDIKKKNREMPKQKYVTVYDTVGFEQYAERFKKQFIESQDKVYLEELSRLLDSTATAAQVKNYQYYSDTLEVLYSIIDKYSVWGESMQKQKDSIKTQLDWALNMMVKMDTVINQFVTYYNIKEGDSLKLNYQEIYELKSILDNKFTANYADSIKFYKKKVEPKEEYSSEDKEIVTIIAIIIIFLFLAVKIQ